MNLRALYSKIAMAVVVIAAMAAAASAQPRHLQPASTLLYPLFDSAPGAGTIICVTNTNTERAYCPDEDARGGEVLAHFVYIDGETWREFDRYEWLTPGDTLCVMADQHNPEGEMGFLTVTAIDPNDGMTAIQFDYLIGSAIIVQSGFNMLWTYVPYSFLGLPGQPVPGVCDRIDTDADGDGVPDFDGVEYSLFPDEVIVSSFFEESERFPTSLTLMTTAGSGRIAEVDVLFWNNIEQKFSRSFEFTCFWTGSLSDISAKALDLGGDPDEMGAGGVQNGWASFRGSRITDLVGNPVLDGMGGAAIPPLAGVFAQSASMARGSGGFSAGGVGLAYRGTLDGLELDGGDGDPQGGEEVETDLAVTKDVEESKGIFYTITVENLGPNDATNVVVRDNLPTGIMYISDETDDGSYDPGTGLWTIGTIPSGETVELIIVVDFVFSVGEGEGIIVNVASLESLDQIDTNPENDSDSAAVEGPL